MAQSTKHQNSAVIESKVKCPTGENLFHHFTFYLSENDFILDQTGP